jgi:plastocyanin
LQVLGLLLMALAPLLMLGAALAWGLDVGDDGGFFGVTTAIPLIGAFLAWRFGAWAKIVAIVTGLLTGMALFWTAFGLFAPNSVFDFVPGLLVLPGLVLVIVAGIKAFRAARRGDVVASAEGGERRTAAIVLGVVGVLALLSAVLTATGQESVDDTSDAAFTVVATDFEFDKAAYEASAGDTILVRNKDPFAHTFTVDELDVDVTLSPGSEKLVTLPGTTGEFIAYCEPHTSDPDDPSEDDMASRLEVR